MITGKEVVNKIEATLLNEKRASIRITRALKALEAGCYIVARQAAELALTEAEFIEQRMACLAILMICEHEDDVLTKKFLTSAYDI